jgi:hypothetical protein
MDLASFAAMNLNRETKYGGLSLSLLQECNSDGFSPIPL